MTIRPRRPEDLPSCVTVLTEVHDADGYPEARSAVSAGWLDPPGTIAAWVAQPDGEIRGHVSLIAEPPVADAAPGGPGRAGVVKLSRLFVAPMAQGRGVARQLMTTAVSWAEGQGWDVVLEVYEGTAAVAVYERLGWRFLSRGPAAWTGVDGRPPMLRHYAAPGPTPRK